jgi:hypothetical protein
VRSERLDAESISAAMASTVHNGVVRTPRRRLLGRLATIVAAATAAILIPGVAYAGDGPWRVNRASPCSVAISPHTGGGQGWAHLDYDAYRASTRKYVIEYGDAWADSFIDCISGYPYNPYKITISLQFRFDGTSLSCGGGIDVSFPRSAGLSFSCSVSGTRVIEKISTTCTTRRPSCRIDQGYLEVLNSPGDAFANYVYAQATATVRNEDGDVTTWSTGWV